MKKLMVILVSMAVMWCGSAFAVTEDLTLSVGMKSWYNWFEPHANDYDTSAAFMIGPTAKAQYKNMYLGITYLTSTSDYEPLEDSNMSRDDLDIVVGYMLTPRLGLNVGYKGIYTDVDEDDGSASFHLAALGVGGNIPLYDEGLLFMNVNGLAGTFDVDSPDTEDADVLGVSAELGAVFSIIKNLTANAGFKYQYLDVEGEGATFYGPTLGLDYRF